MIPLVILDVDGVLIGKTGHVLDCVWQAAEKARTAGVKLAVCTGRPCGGVAQRVAQRLGPNNPHIFQSGSLIAYTNGEVVRVSALKEAATRQLIEHARERSFVLELYTPNAAFVERRTALSEAHAKMIGIHPIVRDLAEVARNEPVVRAQWVLNPEQFPVAKSLPVNGVTISAASSPALKDTYFISVTQEGVSKGSGVRLLCEALKVNPANVMAIGDSEGDEPMLDAVGHAVVMANAQTTLRRRYKNAVGHVDDCGVVEAFDMALKLKKV